MASASLAPTPTTNNHEQPPAQALPTFLDHVHELRRRLFWVVAVVVVASAVSYGFINDILGLLTAPLGDKQLYYLTPAGGLTFAIKLCTFVGFVVGVPVLMYHLYRFFEPLMGSKRRSSFFYVGLSTLFAAAGVAFAYVISLPAALHFLTNFNLNNVQAMLTVDSYLTFVITYLLGAALLFQIPLLLLIINTMTPLKPSKLMKLQKFVIVGAFILAAVISPTPDIMNQAFLAIPIIAMYQLGIGLVWWQNAASARKARRRRDIPEQAYVEPDPAMALSAPAVIPTDVLAEFVQPGPAPELVKVAEQEPAVAAKPMPVAQTAAPRPKQRMMVDVARPSAVPRRVPVRAPQPRQTLTQQVRPAPKLTVPNRSVDGFMRPASVTSS
jgi:sec-independent protein translocase protein TatC